MSRGDKYLALVRREIWEHRSLWLAPVGAAALLLVAATFGALQLGNGVHVTMHQAPPPDVVRRIGELSLLGIYSAIGVFAGIATLAYLLDCLYAERRDRSILFWKSLPVSDAETVLTKLVVALLLVPLFVLLLALVLQPVLAVIAGSRLEGLRPHIGEIVLAGEATLPQLLGYGGAALLWYAPLAGYIMLASVLARRAPIVYAAMPPVVLSIGERLLFGTHHVADLAMQRLLPWAPRDGTPTVHGGTDGPVFDANWWQLYQDPGLWIGVVVAVAMVFALIRLRRYRDDT